jgi:hypothetical protein
MIRSSLRPSIRFFRAACPSPAEVSIAPGSKYEKAGRKAKHSSYLSGPSVLGTSTESRAATRNVSVFTQWSDMDWHRPDFMSDAALKEKESWLEDILNSNQRAVDIEAFLLVLNALASGASQDAGAARRAERWMSRLRQQENVHPTVECYQAVIQAWANSNKEQPVVIVNRAERWLNDFLADCEEMAALEPTIECYNAFLDACTRGRTGKDKRKNVIVETHAKKADAILRRLHSQAHYHGEGAMVVPNTDTFNFVIRGWTRCREDDSIAQRVLSLLRLMESYQRENPVNSTVRPDTKSYSMAMDALITVAKLTARRCVQKNNKLNDDPSQNGLSEMQEAQAVLAYMHDLYDAGVEGVLPHRVPYNILITGWAALATFGHQDAPFEAEQILRKMISYKDTGFTEAGPDSISYEKVMLAWANSGHLNAGKRATWWLKKLWNDAELESDMNLLPTTRTHNIVMKALAVTEDVQGAENLLLDLGDKFREEQAPERRPNSESFSVVIRAWLQKAEHHPNIDERTKSLDRAVEWLSSLREVENEKDLSTAPELFSGVLRAARKSARMRVDVLDLARRTFDDLRQSRHGVNSVSFSALLEVGLAALAGPLDDEARNIFIQEVFEDCRDEGLISNTFIRALRDSRTYADGWTAEERERMTNEFFSEWPLPASWTRNLRSRRFFPKPDDAGLIGKSRSIYQSNREGQR